MSRKLFTVGPVNVPDDVLKAMDRPMITHRSSEYKQLHADIEEKLHKALGTDNDIFMVAGSATVLLEGAARNGIREHSLGLTSGSFGDRSIEVATTNGRKVDVVRVPMGKAVKPADIEGKVGKDIEAVHWVSNESSTGVYCDNAALAEEVRSQNPDALVMIDAVTSMFAMDLDWKRTQPDSVVFGSQKDLALPPGLAFVVVSPEFMKKSESMENKGFYTDFVKLKEKNDENYALTTPPVSIMFGLDYQLDKMLKEGMAARYRMMAVSKKMQDFFQMGDVEGALAQLDTLLSMAQLYRARDVIVDTYWVYYQYHKDRRNADAANRYFQLYLENKDSLLTYDKLTDITELNFQTQLNRAGEQVRILSYKRRMQGYLLGGVAAFALAIIAVLVGLAYNYRQLRTKNRQLYEKHTAMIAEMRKTSELQKKYDEQQKTKYSGSKLGGDTLTLLEQRIAQVLENSDEIYAEDFDIKTLADLTGSNQAYVSQVINTKYGKSFSSLLGEYRVNEASRRLADLEHYGDYTIEAIAQSVGFKSRTSFVALFKKLTGLTPSAYQKMARQG